MKRLALVSALVLISLCAAAQTDKDTVFITISNDDVFSKCFAICDSNADGIVSYREAARATKLSMDYGGRRNIISNYDFLQYFPNLTHFSVGNTPVEELDLSKQPKLEMIDLRGGLWMKQITIVQGCNPQIYFPFDTEVVTIKRIPSLAPFGN